MAELRVIMPKVFIPVERIAVPVWVREQPLFFLLGPIRGADDWQTKACFMLRDMLESKLIDAFWVANPRRYLPEHELWKMAAPSEPFEPPDYPPYPNQTMWERQYLSWAACYGSIIGWLPAESPADPRVDGHPYARDTRGELGEWRARVAKNRRLNFALGGEEGFSGLDVIKTNFAAMLGEDWPIFSTLQETVAHAVHLACSRYGILNK